MTEQTAPLQITKDLLKPWSPCTDGYKWFLDKFPQGGTYLAVQAALRADKRFDDARWLTDKVWENVIFTSPAISRDVAADHKTEAIEIIEATKSLKVDAPDSKECSGDDAQIGSSGNAARIGSSWYAARIGSSGYAAKIGSSGNAARIGSSGNAARIGSRGDAARIGSSGDDAQIGSSGNAAKIGSSGYAAQIGSSGYAARIGSSGYAARIGSSGDAARIGSSGDDAQIGSSGDDARIGSSGDDARINASGANAIVACAGMRAISSAGENGAIALPWWDEASNRTRFAVGYVGENIKPGVFYTLDGAGEFTEVAP